MICIFPLFILKKLKKGFRIWYNTSNNLSPLVSCDVTCLKWRFPKIEQGPRAIMVDVHSVRLKMAKFLTLPMCFFTMGPHHSTLPILSPIPLPFLPSNPLVYGPPWGPPHTNGPFHLFNFLCLTFISFLLHCPNLH